MAKFDSSKSNLVLFAKARSETAKHSYLCALWVALETLEMIRTIEHHSLASQVGPKANFLSLSSELNLCTS